MWLVIFFAALSICTASHSILLPRGQTSFSIGVLPDTQYYTAYHRDIFEEQTYWLCQCKDQLTLIFVSQLGDIVDHEAHISEWNAAKNAFDTLDHCNLPFLTLPGNHDTDYNGTDMTYENYDAFINNYTISYDGSYPPGTTHNTYLLFTIWNSDGFQENFLFLSLEYLPSSGALDWAGDVLTNYSSYTVILSTHYALSDCAGSTIYPTIQNLMKAHCNILFVLSGHAFYCGGENSAYISNSSCPNKRQWVFMTDFQGRTNGGDGWLRVYTFNYTSEMALTVCVNTYSPVLDQIETTGSGFFSVNFPSGLNGTGCPGFDPCPSNFERPGVLLSLIGGVIGIFAMLLIHTTIS